MDLENFDTPYVWVHGYSGLSLLGVWDLRILGQFEVEDFLVLDRNLSGPLSKSFNRDTLDKEPLSICSLKPLKHEASHLNSIKLQNVNLQKNKHRKELPKELSKE